MCISKEKFLTKVLSNNSFKNLPLNKRNNDIEKFNKDFDYYVNNFDETKFKECIIDKNGYFIFENKLYSNLYIFIIEVKDCYYELSQNKTNKVEWILHDKECKVIQKNFMEEKKKIWHSNEVISVYKRKDNGNQLVKSFIIFGFIINDFKIEPIKITHSSFFIDLNNRKNLLRIPLFNLYIDEITAIFEFKKFLNKSIPLDKQLNFGKPLFIDCGYEE